MHFLHPLQFRYTLGDLKRVLLLGLCDGQAYQQAIRLLDFGRDSDRVNTHLLGRFDYRWYLDAWLQLSQHTVSETEGGLKRQIEAVIDGACNPDAGIRLQFSN